MKYLAFALLSLAGCSAGTPVFDDAGSVDSSQTLHRLSVTLDGGGDGAVVSDPDGIGCGTACDATYPTGAVVTLTAVALEGSQFDGWSGACAGTGECSITMDDARAVTARFSRRPATVMVTLDGDGAGIVRSTPEAISCGATCAASFDPDSTVTLTATAAVGNAFVGWSGACDGVQPSCELTMSVDRAVTARFEPKVPLAIDFIGPANGFVLLTPPGDEGCSGDCEATYPAGTTVTLTAQPASGAYLEGWGGACFGAEPTCTLTLGPAGSSVTVRFENQIH